MAGEGMVRAAKMPSPAGGGPSQVGGTEDRGVRHVAAPDPPPSSGRFLGEVTTNSPRDHSRRFECRTVVRYTPGVSPEEDFNNLRLSAACAQLNREQITELLAVTANLFKPDHSLCSCTLRTLAMLSSPTQSKVKFRSTLPSDSHNAVTTA